MEGHASETNATVEEWLLAYMRAGIDGVVIADHNEHIGIDEARKTLERMRASGGDDFREITLFPGVEVTADGGTHLIGVFDPSDSDEVINGLLHKAGFTGKRGRSDTTTSMSVHGVCGLISEMGGLAIPAHADGKAGLLGMDARSVELIHEANYVQAVELVGDAKLADAGKFGWTVLLGSDAHHLDASSCPPGVEPKFPGSHFTWIKMQQLTLDGVKLAITDGTGSVRRSTDVATDPNRVDHHHIQSITIRQGSNETQIPLSPWLNAFIGGRGVGKSTIVETARLALGRFGELPSELARDLTWFSPVPSRTMGERFWDNETHIEVVYSKSDRTYRITWNGTSQNSAIDVKTDGLWVRELGHVPDRFPALIYSQKQIYETAKNPQSLLAIIDAQPDIHHASWADEFQALKFEYAETLQKISGFAALIESEDRLRGELADLTVLIEASMARRDSPEAKELDSLREAEAIHQSAEIQAAAFSARLEASLEDFGAVLKSSKESRQGWSPSEMRHAEEETAVSNVEETVEFLHQSLVKFVEQGQSPRQERIVVLRDLLGEGQSEVDGVQGSFEELVGNRARVLTRLEDIAKARTDSAVATAHAETTLSKIKAHRLELTTRRSAFLSSLSLDPKSLKVDLHHIADQRELERELRALTQRPAGFEGFFSGESGVNKVLKSDPRNPRYRDEVDSLRSLLKEIYCDGADSAVLSATGVVVDNRFFTHLRGLDETNYVTGVDLWFPEDLLVVKYKPAGAADYRSLEQGSPGQKTAALLTLILRMSNDPLILDQPEDDLDNELITDLIVNTLGEIKSRRQVIVATHNANIVVNADSEVVTKMKHGTIPAVEIAGSVQSSDVRAAICSIMEGGETAFALRYSRLMA
jgi:hypothetical protein